MASTNESGRLTPAQRARYALTRRLKRASHYVQQAEDQLAHIHSDRSGIYSHLPPARMPELKAVTTMRSLLVRIQQEAAEGCEQSAKFLQEHAEQVEWIERHSRKRPPKRAPDFKPPAVPQWAPVPPLPGHGDRFDGGEFEPEAVHAVKWPEWRR